MLESGVHEMSTRITLACAALLFGLVSSASGQSVSLQFENGRVNLNAQNAPLRTILVEWQRSANGTRGATSSAQEG